ncbi:metal regulatory transcription factor 1 [Trichonephila clavipes]|uniref:Metal regulatory transcription factor 1 n=1 Tax=Trichonephila clavipes TaxID=2585209 RepID=A0A8X6RNT7_TRICX|nr:metal regulatory transcription factor 1 [Trichonephila clavipes]
MTTINIDLHCIYRSATNNFQSQLSKMVMNAEVDKNTSRKKSTASVGKKTGAFWETLNGENNLLLNSENGNDPSLALNNSLINLPCSEVTINTMPDGTMIAYAVIRLGNANAVAAETETSETTTYVEGNICVDKSTQAEDFDSENVSPINASQISGISDSVLSTIHPFNLSESVMTENVNMSSNPVPVQDIISTSAQLAEICKCGPNKCKPHGRCCMGCPGMEGHYCRDDDDSGTSTTADTGVLTDENNSYTLAVTDTPLNDIHNEEIYFADASCQTEEGLCPAECTVSLGRETVSLYKDFQHSNGGCCVHS